MIGLEHYLAVAATLFIIGVFRAFSEQEKRHYSIDVDRIDAACGQYQSCCVLKLSR